MVLCKLPAKHVIREMTIPLKNRLCNIVTLKATTLLTTMVHFEASRKKIPQLYIYSWQDDTSMSQAIIEHFCIMAYMTSKRSPGDERFCRTSIDSEMPPVKSTRALLVCPPIPMLSYPPFNLHAYIITTKYNLMHSKLSKI